MSTATKPISSRPLRIFFSYAEGDREQAQRVRTALALRAGVHLFADDTLGPGEDLSVRLRDEIDACDIFIIVLSVRSLKSQWAMFELGMAWGAGKPILLVPAS